MKKLTILNENEIIEIKVCIKKIDDLVCRIKNCEFFDNDIEGFYLDEISKNLNKISNCIGN